MDKKRQLLEALAPLELPLKNKEDIIKLLSNDNDSDKIEINIAPLFLETDDASYKQYIDLTDKEYDAIINNEVTFIKYYENDAVKVIRYSPIHTIRNEFENDDMIIEFFDSNELNGEIYLNYVRLSKRFKHLYIPTDN